MANTLDDQLSAFGVAQVIVVLNDVVAPAVITKASAALAAAIPVRGSKSFGSAIQDTVLQLGDYFRLSETSIDTALAAAKTAGRAARNWYERAKSSASPTPAARFYPNLGLMLGTVDSQGLAALRSNPHVKQVIAPPRFELIYPIARSAVSPPRAYTWGIERLRADALHARGLSGEGVIVGHLDTGVDGDHPALKDAIHVFAEFDSMGFEVNPAPKPHDTDEHGTHTAGTIAGRTVGGRAISVAPGAMLASAIVIEGGNVNARVLAGMDWIVGQGARVLSMSLGFPNYTPDFLPLTQILRQRGVLPVFAVGNEGPGTSRSPGNYVEALSVGAMGEDEKVADFSSSRRFTRPVEPLVPDLVAPGVGVISAKPGGGYQQMDGTSMATPHIAGLAALLMQADPSATIDQIEKAIFDSCRPLPSQPTERQNRGVPDAVQALALLPNVLPQFAAAAAARAPTKTAKRTTAAKRPKTARKSSVKRRAKKV